MAQAPSGRRKPRVRKSAPTIRQRVEAAQVEAESPKKSRWPLKKANKPSKTTTNPALTFVKQTSRPFRKILKWLVPSYFINSWREVRQVTWPNRKETWRLTLAVFIFAIVFGALVAVVDKGLDEFFKKVILK